ncbi:MAG: hypothetical protein H6627_11660 [Calditrichae bacterium]|nr:hypothetical protein [Calditrichota bacterium]MCB9059215.1 hypothetical protein [Calditrichia bacterium]
MNKILIIDRDSTTLNDISRLIVALKFEPLVAFNTASLSGIIRSEIAAIFIDVETKMVRVDEVIRFFNNPQKVKHDNIIPFFLMYTNEDSVYIDQAKRLPHADVVKKPVVLENIFKMLNKHLNLNEVEYEQFSNYYRLDQLQTFGDSLKQWLEKLGSLLEH